MDFNDVFVNFILTNSQGPTNLRLLKEHFINIHIFCARKNVKLMFHITFMFKATVDIIIGL